MLGNQRSYTASFATRPLVSHRRVLATALHSGDAILSTDNLARRDYFFANTDCPVARWGSAKGHLCVKTFDTIGAKAKLAIILTGTVGHTGPNVIDTNWEGMVGKMFVTVG